MHDTLIIPGSQLYKTWPDVPEQWYDRFARQRGNALVADLPIPPNQTWDTWSPVLDSAIGELRPSGLIVTHSMGSVAAILALQDRINRGETVLPYSLLFVAPFFSLHDAVDKYDKPEESNLSDFVSRDLDLASIRQALTGKVRMMYTIDDPICPPETQDYVTLAQQLRADTIELPTGKHFDGINAGGHFDLILSESRSLLEGQVPGRVEKR